MTSLVTDITVSVACAPVQDVCFQLWAKQGIIHLATKI